MLVKSLYAFFLAWPVYYGIKRALRPALVEEPRAARRPRPADGAGSLGRMFLRTADRPRGSRLSLRIAVLGGIAVALFAVLFFRLWNLQILDGGKNLAEAQNNRTREYQVIAPRGKILARNGKVLVDNRTSLALVVNTAKLPADPSRGSGRAEETRLARPHVAEAGPQGDRRSEEVPPARR